MRGWLLRGRNKRHHRQARPSRTRHIDRPSRRSIVIAVIFLLVPLGLLSRVQPAHAAAVCDVTLNTDANPPTGNTGELRWAINQANASNCVSNTITFHIGATGSTQTITLASGQPLPNITAPVLIDGSTQDTAGTICNATTGPAPEIVIDASAIGSGAALVLDNGSGGSQIKGLVIINSPNEGILGYSSNNTIDCNYIGLAADGVTAAGSNFSGIYFLKNLANPSPSNNTIGGTTAAVRNVIADYGAGIEIDSAGSSGNVIEGNYIGTDASGTAAVPNSSGVLISTAATNNTIGGTAAGAGNLISGSTFSGVEIVGTGTSNNVVTGNTIGTDVTITVALANTYGVNISGATNNRVGGTTVAERNIISGNNVGVEIGGAAGTSSNVVSGNYIGTNATGTTAIANGSGVILYSGATSNTIGGTTAGARNIISGNSSYGVHIENTSTSNNVVRGNYVGTNVTGSVALTNNVGISIDVSASSNTIGGTTAGARNLVSGNNVGIEIQSATNVVSGNYIGTDVNGTAALANTFGVLIFNGTSNTIGGTTAGAGNLISGNGIGVEIQSLGATNNVISGNFIGTDVTGTAALANNYGVLFFNGATSNTVGGTTAGARNIIAGNNFAGVEFQDSTTTSNIVRGNYIGTDSAGTAAVGNSIGVEFVSGTSGNTIGGTTAGARNIIAASSGAGINIQDTGTNSNIVQNNFIGTDASGTVALPNAGGGVNISNGAQNNIIGGIAAGQANLITLNTGAGVHVEDPTTTGNSIRGNHILSNTGLGIDLNNDGVTSNDTGDADSGPNNLQNFPVLTSVTGVGASYMVSGTLNSTPSTGPYTLDFYSSVVCNGAGNGDGKSYLGSATVSTDGTGNANFGPVSLSGFSGETIITSTATDPSGSTSEFSSCTVGPVLTSAPPSPAITFGPAAVVAPPDALTIVFTSNSNLIVSNDPFTLSAVITNSSSSTVNNVVVRLQAADEFNVLSTSANLGTTQISCQLGSVTLPSMSAGQQLTIIVTLQLDPAALTNGETDNVIATEYDGGRLKTAGQKVAVVRKGTLPATGYPPPPESPGFPPLSLLGIAAALTAAVLVTKRVHKHTTRSSK